MKKYQKLLFLLFMSLFISQSNAADNPYSLLRQIGRITEKNVTGSQCFVTSVADYDAYIPYLPQFREAWLNRDFTNDFYLQRRKQVFLFSIVKRLAEVVTEGLYMNQKNVDICDFEIKVIFSDIYGQRRSFTAVTWRFNRRIFNMTNWERFDPRDFNKIAINYLINDISTKWYSDEPSFQ